jgi:hypothetical protein
MSDDAAISFTDFELEEARAIELATQPSRKLDNQLNVQFYKHAELNAFKSREQNRKIFDDHTYIRIMAPANRLMMIERRATDDDKLRFPNQYNRFFKGQTQLSSGTPLSELHTITAAQVMELKALNVETIEQLAGIPDTTAQLMGMGGLEIKRRAQRFMDLSTDKTVQGEKIRNLEAQLAELLAERQAAQTASAAKTPEVKVTSSTGPAAKA